MNIRNILVTSLAGLVLSCSTTIPKIGLVPSRVDVSGRIEKVEYLQRGLGMEKSFQVTLKTSDGEEKVFGYGQNDYKRFKAAHNKEVGIQCMPNPFDTTCRVYAFKVEEKR